MVFHAIGMWLLAAAVPLWVCRWYMFFKLEERERAVFRRLVSRRLESPYYFALRIFGFLVALAISVLVLTTGLRYLKSGSLEVGTFSDNLRGRLYSGVEPVDQVLDAFHYDQLLPVALVTTSALLAIAFTLVATALRDIVMIRKLDRKLEKLRSRHTASA